MRLGMKNAPHVEVAFAPGIFRADGRALGNYPSALRLLLRPSAVICPYSRLIGQVSRKASLLEAFANHIAYEQESCKP